VADFNATIPDITIALLETDRRQLGAATLQVDFIPSQVSKFFNLRHLACAFA